MITRVILTSFALCSMYFGSGNVVFPLLLGVETQSYYTLALLGWNLTSVFLPLVGMLSVVRFQCSPAIYFEHLGKKPALLLIVLIMGLLGPFGIIPRCIALSLGTVQNGIMDISPVFFNALFSIFTILLVIRPEKTMHLLATIVTPFKIGSISILMLVGIVLNSDGSGSIANPVGMAAQGPWDAFVRGVFHGYNTLDLLGGFFFSKVVVDYLRAGWRGSEPFTPSIAFRYTLISCAVAAVFLSALYTAITYLAAVHAHELLDVQPRMLLAALASVLFGPWGAPVTAFVVTVTCLSTASVLLLGWSNLIQEQMVSRGYTIFSSRAVFTKVILCSSFTGYIISLLGFEEIVSMLGYLMTYVYPFLIVDVIYSYFRRPAWHGGEVGDYFARQAAGGR